MSPEIPSPPYLNILVPLMFSCGYALDNSIVAAKVTMTKAILNGLVYAISLEIQFLKYVAVASIIYNL